MAATCMMAARASSRLVRSSLKVRSLETDLAFSGVAASATTLLSSPAALSAILGPMTPKTRERRSGSVRASSPRVRTPISCRRRSVAWPMPLIALTGSGARKAACVPGNTTVRPRGFSRSEAIFATVLLTPRPMEQVTPSSPTRAWTLRQMSTGLSRE